MSMLQMKKNMIQSKERKLIKKLVCQVHVTHDGKPRKINYQETKELYYTILPDKQKIYGKTEDVIYEKLFTFYGLSLTDYSFSEIFRLAHEQKAKTENPSPETIRRSGYAYKKFITDKLAQKNIRSITTTDLKEFLQNFVNSQHPTRKAFYACKEILNLAFEYAMEHEIIMTNPLLGVNNSVYYKSLSNPKTKPEEKILSVQEIDTVKSTVRKRMPHGRYHNYFINGYAILLSIETGMRAGEIPSLRWSDIKSDHIHIHSQQLSHKINGKKTYYYADWTKDEKGISQGGRTFPLTDTIKDILGELKALQTSLGIESEYIFCHADGRWITTDAYEECLRDMLKGLGYTVFNNHALRMSLNSNVFIAELNLPVTERARLLGHSVETNLKYYSFAVKDNTTNICERLNNIARNKVSPRSHPNVAV